MANNYSSQEGWHDNGDPFLEPTNALLRLMDGKKDPGVDVALANFAANNPDVLRGLMLNRDGDIGDETDELLQKVRQDNLIRTVAVLWANNGEHSLGKALGVLRGFVTCTPADKCSAEVREEIFQALDHIEADAQEYVYPKRGFDALGDKLTPEHVYALMRLRVLTYDRISSLLRGIQVLGALKNPGKSMDEFPFTLLDFCEALRSGLFLQNFSLEDQDIPEGVDVRVFIEELIDKVLVVFSETANHSDIEVRSAKEIYDLLPLAQEEVIGRLADKDLDESKKHLFKLIHEVLSCISEELPGYVELDLPDEPLTNEDAYDEDGFLVGLQHRGVPWEGDDDEDDEDPWGLFSKNDCDDDEE